MAAMTKTSPTAQEGASPRVTQSLDIDITMMDTRTGDDGSREFHFWGRFPDGRPARAHFTVPGEIGCDIILAVQKQLQKAQTLSAHGRWTSKNVAPGKNVWTFRIEVIDSISTALKNSAVGG
jgi:hypothetical protein